jgi:hypothetical protein
MQLLFGDHKATRKACFLIPCADATVTLAMVINSIEISTLRKVLAIVVFMLAGIVIIKYY